MDLGTPFPFARAAIALAAAAIVPLACANDVAVVVGVSDYKAFNGIEGGDLKYADEDARLFAKTAVAQMEFAEKDVIILTSRPQGRERLATSAAISEALREASRQIDPKNSRFFFYFSGHGIWNDNGPLLAAQDFDPGHPAAATALSAEAIRTFLADRPVRLAAAFFDMCRQGGTLVANPQTNASFRVPKARAERVVTVYSSAQGRSFEDDESRHGFFTAYLCRGLTAQPTEPLPTVPALDGGAVTFRSLQAYMLRVLPLATANLSGPLETSNTKAKEASQATIGQIPWFDIADAPNDILCVYDRNQYRPELSPTEKYDALVSVALQHYGDGEYGLAGDGLMEAFKLHAFRDRSQQAWAAYAAGNAYIRAGKIGESESCWKSAIIADPGHTRAMYNLGFSMFTRSDLIGAEAQFRSVIAADPNASAAMNNLGLVLERRGDPIGAEAQYRAAISVDPLAAMAMYNLGVLLEKRGDWSGAEAQYRAATKADPKDADSCYNLGLLLEKRGDRRGAEAQYRIAISADPACADAMYNLGLLLAKRFDLPGAEKQFRDALGLRPKDGLICANLAVVLFGQRKMVQAKEFALKAKDLGLKVHPAYKLLGLEDGKA